MLLGNAEESETKEKCQFCGKSVFILIKVTVEFVKQFKINFKMYDMTVTLHLKKIFFAELLKKPLFKYKKIP